MVSYVNHANPLNPQNVPISYNTKPQIYQEIRLTTN